jgi:hypothetical protein
MGGNSSITPNPPQNLLIPPLPASLKPVHTLIPNLKPNRHSNSHDFRTTSIKIPTHRKRVASTDHVSRIDIREVHPILPSKPSNHTLHNPVYTGDSTCGTISPSFRSLKPVRSKPESSLFSYSRPPSHTSCIVSSPYSSSPSLSTYKLIHSGRSSPKRPKVRFTCPEGEASDSSGYKSRSNSRVKVSCKVRRYSKK